MGRFADHGDRDSLPVSQSLCDSKAISRALLEIVKDVN